MIGVALGESEMFPPRRARRGNRPPRIREIAELMDPLPALPPKLIELGRWISHYYLAPIGEAFRAMLPPEIETAPRPRIFAHRRGPRGSGEFSDG